MWSLCQYFSGWIKLVMKWAGESEISSVQNVIKLLMRWGNRYLFISLPWQYWRAPTSAAVSRRYWANHHHLWEVMAWLTWIPVIFGTLLGYDSHHMSYHLWMKNKILANQKNFKLLLDSPWLLVPPDHLTQYTVWCMRLRISCSRVEAS